MSTYEEPEPGWVLLDRSSSCIKGEAASMADAVRMIEANSIDAGKTRKDYENHELPHRNRLPPRAYSVPSGERYIDLNGTWRFHFATTVFEAEQVDDNPASQWGKIEVPGMWQLQGHGKPWYTNVQFPFPVRPPLVPTENETGTYERTINLKEAWLDQYRAVLRFDGVDSAFHVFVNGKEAGFSKGSRNAAEFDVSPLLKVGKNVIRVRVYRWSDGSYIEDQDQWWLSGIFRDVALLGYDKRASFVDFAVTTDFDKAYKDATLAIDLKVQLVAPVICKVRLLDVTGQTIVAAAHNIVINKPEARLEYLIDAPTKWTAETPHLYTLQLSLRSEDKIFDEVEQKVGFRKVEVKDGLVCINGSPIHFSGVNRHDHHPQFGRAVPLSFVREDLQLMKRHNINAVRTSHYPNHPKVLDMFDELGFYVIAECDLECHGFDDVSPRIRAGATASQASTAARRAPESWTSDSPEWREAYVERMRQLVQRDINHPSVVFWSLGNESFFGANHRAMAAWARAHDKTRLIHYEPDHAAEVTDVYSYMYTSITDLINMAKQKDWTKPIILCEYAHAMGNGPGGLRDYQEVFRKYRRLQGGFVWEWANHGLAQKTAAGVEYMAYGPDFDTAPNDGTFCMDGLCDSSHRPTPGLLQLKSVFAPVGLERSGDKLKLTNYYDLLTLAHIECRWQFFRLSLTDRAKGMLQEGVLHIPELQAGQSAELDFPKTGPPRGDDEHILAFSFTLKEATAWAPAGHELAHVDFVTQAWQPPSPPARGSSTPSVVEESLSYHITTAKDGYVIDKRTGRLMSWLHGGRELLCATSQQTGVKASFWRPPTDNDLYGDAGGWREHGLDRLRERLESLEVEKADMAVTITAQSSWAATSLTSRIDTTTTYTITADKLTIKLKGQPAGTEQSSTLPRRGLELLLDPGFASIEWSGLGPGESYADSQSGIRLDLHRSSVDDLFYRYEVPQEAGNRHSTRWLALRLPSGYFAPQTILRVHCTRQPLSSLSSSSSSSAAAEKGAVFDFNASRYTAQAIEDAMHPHELKQSDGIVLHIDERVHGLGTASCGPGVLPQYRCLSEAFELEVVLAAAPY